jgi:uncharacterized protein
MTVVSNASPLINLSRIGKIDLLHSLFGALVIPEAVWSEVVVEGQGLPGAQIVESCSWITRPHQMPKDGKGVPSNDKSMGPFL